MSFELLDYKHPLIQQGEYHFPMRLQKMGHPTLTASFQPEIERVLKHIGLGETVFFPKAIRRRNNEDKNLKPLTDSPFWRHKNIPIPWDEVRDGEVVVFYRSGGSRENQLWIVKKIGQRKLTGNKKLVYVFSYLLITPWERGQVHLPLPLYQALGYRGQINNEESWVTSTDGTVYFWSDRERHPPIDLYWTIWEDTAPFMNWLRGNPLEVK